MDENEVLHTKLIMFSVSNMLLWTHSIPTYWKPRETRFLMVRVLNDCRIKELLKLDYFIYLFFSTQHV